MIKKLSNNVVRRNFPAGGPSDSTKLNALVQETSISLSSLTSEWNDNLQPLLDTLPGGRSIINNPGSLSPDAFLNGFDGANIYIDNLATPQRDAGFYFSTVASRPLTIKEGLSNLKSYIDQLTNDLRLIVVGGTASGGGGLTAVQKSRIGNAIFDLGASSGSSLDGLTQTHTASLSQLAADTFNSNYPVPGTGIGQPPTYTFTGAGVGTLANSITDMLTALLDPASGHTWVPGTNTVTHSLPSGATVTKATYDIAVPSAVLDLTGASLFGADVGTPISTMTLQEMHDDVEVYLNGQLLTHYLTAFDDSAPPQYDFRRGSTQTKKLYFNPSLSADDRVVVIVRT